MAKKAGTIPFQVINGTFWICLISSKKRKGKFVLPKGSVRSSERSREAAIRETFEEAGLKGKISKKSVKIKAKSAGDDLSLNTNKFFPLKITDINDHWPEQKMRERLWVDLKNLPTSKMVKRDVLVIKSRRFNTIIENLMKTVAA